MEAEETLKLFDSSWFGPEGPNLFDSCWREVVELFRSCLLIGPKVVELCDSWSEPTGGSSTAMLMAYQMDESKILKNLRIRSFSDRCLGVNVSGYCEEGAASKGIVIGKPKDFSGEVYEEENAEKSRGKEQRRRRRMRRKRSMDLGFVFNEEGKNPGLISVIPRVVDDDEEGDGGEKGRTRNSMMDSKIPSLQNEIRMKNHLRVWAHIVASNVR